MRTLGCSALGLLALTGVLALTMTAVHAQIPMPDPREMSGIPLPSGDLSDGAVSVRVIRGELSNNIIDHPVDLHAGADVRTVRTDENGRAQFMALSAGALVSVSAIVDGERLASSTFAVPSRGGIRVMLVATPGEAGATVAPSTMAPAPTSAPAPAPRAGAIVFGGDSRWVVEMSDQAVEVYYLLEAVNTAAGPVTPAEAVAFDLPASAQAAALLEGSSAQARLEGSRVVIDGPFAPGRTPVNIAYILPYSGSSLEITQRMPASLEQFAIVAEKPDGVRLMSPQVTQEREMSASGRNYIVGGGPGVAAGGTLTFQLTGLPHRATVPRNVALALAVLLIVWTVWASLGNEASRGAARQRQTLEGRREKLYGELVRVETEHRSGTTTDAWYAKRRQELIAQLERVYRRLEHGVAGGAHSVLPASG